MGFRFYRRIPVDKNTGINVSKSGFSASTRGGYGSIGTKGFSIRTGIPGLGFRKSWSGSSKGRGLDMLFIILLSFIFIYVAYNILVLVALIIYNVFGLIFDLIRYLFRTFKYYAFEQEPETPIFKYVDDSKWGVIHFSTAEFPERFKDTPFYLHEIFINNDEKVYAGNMLCTLSFLGTTAPLYSKNNGTLRWCKMPGQQLFNADELAKIKLDEPSV